MQIKLISLLSLSSLMILSGCESAKTALGITKNTPDEFRVVTRAPLTLPPNYQLKPPQPGKQRPQEKTSYQVAQEALIGKRTTIVDRYTPRNASSNGEQALLSQAGATSSPRDIRQVIDGEASQGQSFKDALLQKPTANTQTVNPVQERQRLITEGVSKDNKVSAKVEKPKPWWKRVF